MFYKARSIFIGIFIAFFASVFVTNHSAFALQLSALEPIYNSNDAIELNEPTATYDFDATFLDQNLELTYNATVTNDAEYDIKITNIDFNTSNYEFLEYSYRNIAKDDILTAGESRAIKIYVKTNNQPTRTVSEDLNLSLNYEFVDQPNAPPKDEPTEPEAEEVPLPSTSDNVAIVAAIFSALSLAAFFVVRKNSRGRHLVVLLALPILGALLFSHSTNASGDYTFSIRGKVRFINTYTVTVDPNGGNYAGSSDSQTTTVRDGETFTIGDNPTRDTYEFKGWTYDSGNFSGSIPVTGDITIIANWEEIYHTVTIDANGGNYSGETSVQVRDGDTFHIGANPTRATFTFQGWETNPDNLDPNSNIVVTQDISFKALWNENYHTITFNPAGGIYNGQTEQYTESIREGDRVTMGTPTREHYRFTGWELSEGALDANNQFIVSKPITVTATWEQIYHRVTINPNGGKYNNSASIFEQNYPEGTELSITNPTREHYTFAGWTATPNLLNGTSLTVSEDVTLVANWTPIYHTVTINPNGGEYTGETSIQVFDGDTFHIGANPTRETYAFAGWQINPNNLDPNANITVTGDIIFTAQWDEIYHNITIDPNGGKYNNSTSIYESSLREGTEITISEPTRAHYSFTGWTITGNQIENGKIILTEDTTLVANWAEVAHHLTINPNGGKYNNSTAIFEGNFQEGTPIDVSTPTREHYTFGGWSTTGDSVNNNQITLTQDTVLTAQWNEIYHTVTVNPNDGEYIGETSVQIFDGDTFHIGANPTRTTYTFAGWTIEPSNLNPNADIVVTEDIVFTAQWDEIYHNITIDPNGGSYDGHTASYTEPYREGATVTMSTPTREHYTFTGWTMSTGELDNENKFTVSQDVTLTAQWQEIRHNLTINPNGGDYDGHTESFTDDYSEGTTVSLSIPTKTGCDFDYWVLEDNSHYTSSSIDMTQDYILTAHYSDKYFNISVNPNGGKFNDSTEIYTDRVKYGTVIDLSNTEFTEHEIRDWTKNETETLPADTASITITEDTDLVINWWSSIFYTVTIIPNGGTYHDSTETQSFPARKGEPFTFDDIEYEGYIMTGWTLDSDTHIANNSIIVTQDETAAAHWVLAVARIERTQQVYPSIMAAHEDANPGEITDDIITLLVDTEEIVTNEKKITLNLNEHTLSGYLHNTTNGNITLLNGEINNYDRTTTDTINTSGAAVINDGTLTMGIDDYVASGAVNIVRDYIRLIGTDVGLDQNGTFYFYDGFIEGNIGLDGGYNGSPFYRQTDIGTIIYYFPLVTHNELKDCQHVELQNADRAVTKTIVNGDIYYYNLQDNINTSARTGYDIYAIRDFDASYPITVAENTNITFDIIGYTVQAGNDWTINGTLNITDSKSAEETGALKLSFPIINTGNLNLKNVKVSALSALTAINNQNNLTLINSTLSSEYGYALEVTTTDTTLTMDDNSYIKSDTKKITPVYNSSSNFTITGGHITSVYRTIYNDEGAKLTITSGEITANRDSYASDSEPAAINNQKGSVTINGGTISSTTTSSNSNCNNAIAIRTIGGDITVAGNANITASSDKTSAYGIKQESGANTTLTINGGTISANGKATTRGVENNNKLYINGGTITATTNDPNSAYTAYAAYFYNAATATVTGGTITANSTKGEAAALQASYDSSISTLKMSGGEAIAHSVSGTATGANLGHAEITGGTITGDTYGVNGHKSNNLIALGTNNYDEETSASILTDAAPIISGGSYGIIGGYVSFYDGIIKGSNAAQNESPIKATPNDAHIVTDIIDGKECAWLVHDTPYLSFDGVEYNSLTKAYNAAIQSNTEPKIIEVIADYSGNVELPTIEKSQDITIDLHGHTVTYSQSLKNYGSLTITDLSNDKNGTLINNNTAGDPTIYNYGAYTQNAGTIKNHFIAVKNYSQSTQLISSSTLNGGKIIVTAISDTYTGTINGVSCDNGNTSNVSIANGFEINVSSTAGEVHALGNYCRTTVDGGTITATSTNSTAYGIYSNSPLSTINGGTITATSTNSTAYGIRSRTDMKGGSVKAVSITKGARGIDGNSSTVKISGGTVEANGQTDNTYGVSVSPNSSKGELTMSGGSIKATTVSGKAYGANLGDATITGGTITGDTYGINGNNTNNYITLGIYDDAIANGANAVPSITGQQYGIYGGYVYFYDGVIKGATPYSTDAIKAIPDGALFHTETIDGLINCWLEYGAKYLRVNGEEYRSLSEAYDNAASGDTIEVIADYSTQADLPINPANKTITLDLHGHHLAYYQTLENKGTLIITDLSPNKNGTITNINPVSTAVVTNDSGGTLKIYAGTIFSTTKAVNNSGTVTIYGGEIRAQIDSASISTSITAVSNNGGNFTIDKTETTHGVVRAISSIANGDTYAISGGTVTVNGGEVIASSATNNSSIYAIYNSSTTVNSGTVTATGLHNAYAIQTLNRTATINGGTITATSENGTTYGLGVGSSTAKVYAGATITSTSTSGNAYGIHASNGSSSRGTSNIYGGTITSKSESAVGYGVATGLGTITGGTITGSTYGLYTNYAKNTITIGDKTNAINTTTPTIIGGTYALYDGSISFYDGVIKGRLGTESGAYFDRNIKTIADNSAIHIETEIIDGQEYEVKYLENEHAVARIGSAEYTSIADAVSHANDGDRIYLLEDNYLFYTLTIPETKNVIIDLDGHTIITGNPINNHGGLHITNSNSETTPLIDYHETDYFINNQFTSNTSTVSPILEISNVKIRANKAIDNCNSKHNTCSVSISNSSITTDFGTTSLTIQSYGTITISNNSTFYSTKSIIDQYDGSTSISNSTLSIADSYDNEAIYVRKGSLLVDKTSITAALGNAIYQNNSNTETTIRNHSTINGSIRVQGKLTVKDSNVSKVAKRSHSLISASGSSSEINIENSTIHLTAAYDSGCEGSATATTNTVVAATGELSIKSSTIKHSYQERARCTSRHISNTGNATLENVTLSTSDDNSESRQSDIDSRTSYGIYNSGTMNFKSGTITVDRATSYGIYTNGGELTLHSATVTATASKDATGIYINNGDVTMGDAEPISSPNYQTENADVSITDPSITAIGAISGTGVNRITGKLNFFDGIIVGSTVSIPRDKITSFVEKDYEPTFHTNENGYDVCILTFMRTSQNQPTGN